MSKINADLAKGREWLDKAARLFDTEDIGSTQAYTAAVIGNGFIGLAHAERAAASMRETSQVRQAILSLSDEPETTLGEAIAREQRAEAEARPHDGEHADDCTGCDGPGIVPCAADRVVGDFAMRDGEPIKDLRGGDRG